MPDKHYYVSAQNGNDANDGLSPATAWKTLTKAAQSISPATDGYTYIHIGPGVYRERFISPSGPSATAKVIWAGDPYCQYLIYDKPGRVRITGCNAQEYPTVGKVLDWTGRTNVELWDVEVDGSKNDYAVYNVEICRRVNVTGYSCFYFGAANSAAYDCTAVGCWGFSSNASNVTYHRCVALALYPFNGSSSYSATAYNCIAIGGNTAFSYCNAYWSIALASNSVAYSSSLIGCITIGSSGGAGRCLFLGSYTTGTGNYAAYHPSVPYISGTADCNEAPHFALDYSILRQLVRFLDVFGIINSYMYHNTNESTSYTMNLSTERIYAFTPPQAGVSYGASILVYTLASSGYVTVELQKYVGTTWVTQASKTLPVSALVAGRWNDFFWDTITGDVNLTTVSNTWRFRITADVNAATTTIYGSSTTTPSIRGWYIPTSLAPLLAQDVNGLTRYDNIFQAGAVVAPNISLDYATYYASYPSIKIVGAGERALELPAKGGEPITVSYYVLHTGAASGKEPQLKVSGPGITQQVATHSAGANVWQKLEVSVTPPTDMLLTVILSSRDKNATVYFSDPYVS